MRKKKISEIMDFIDVNYINEAASYVKLEPSKRPAWKKWGILAACFVVTIIVGVIVLPSVWKSKDSAKELVTIEDLNRPYKEMELEEIMLADIGYGMWPTEFLTLAEKCDALTFAERFYDMYGYTEEKFVGELLGEGECNIYDGVKRGAGNIVGTQLFDVYSLEGISEEIMVVVKIDGEFCLYKNCYYEAETLGEWMDVYQISKNVDLNYCEFSDEVKRQDCFSLTEDDDIWDILEECKNAKRIKDYSGIHANGNEIQFTIDSKKFGKYDNTFTIKEEGYLWTNLFKQREEFFIGEKAAEKIISYVKKYGRKTEMKLRRDYSLSGMITEMADDYILVDDSILCENPEDGMVFKVPTEDIKIRRYVDYLEMQVGDLVWVNFYEGIDVKEGNVVYGVWSIHETVYELNDSLVYREYEIGTECSVGDTVFLDKEKLLQEIKNPTMFVVFYNDEILREIPFDGVSSEMVLERTGYYGFYVRDEEGTLQNVGKFCVNVVLGCVIKDVEEDLSAWKDMIERN